MALCECSWCGSILHRMEVDAHDCPEPESFKGTGAYKVADGNGYRAGMFSVEGSSPIPVPLEGAKAAK